MPSRDWQNVVRRMFSLVSILKCFPKTYLIAIFEYSFCLCLMNRFWASIRANCVKNLNMNSWVLQKKNVLSLGARGLYFLQNSCEIQCTCSRDNNVAPILQGTWYWMLFAHGQQGLKRHELLYLYKMFPLLSSLFCGIWILIFSNVSILRNPESWNLIS